jgi:phosphoribosylaminoimidazolecarboxamide formyltransferase / IMP cyclohydrolase
MRAIISLSNKSGIIPFARGLQEMGIDIFSTGGTKRTLDSAGVQVHSISEITDFPEILDGRVKTLHPAVHGGILARRDLPQHSSELAQFHIEPIDLVIVNLYPFVETIAREGVSLEEALENIDIGGPTLIRSAAKNFLSVLVIVDPSDYDPILLKLRQGNLDTEERKRLAQKAFQHVSLYDTAISQYLNEELFPEEMTIAVKKHSSLRYGENPHQQASFYQEQNVKRGKADLSSLKLLNGPEISFNNLLDFDAALSLLESFIEPTIAILKHTNPCGLATHEDLTEAYRRALSGDPLAAFGGVVASNRSIDLDTAHEIDKTHYDAIIAPNFEDGSLKLLGRKKSLRLVNIPQEALAPDPNPLLDFRRVKGGFLSQTRDLLSELELPLDAVTERQPTNLELSDLLFAWKAVKGIKSNAIAIVKDKTLLGMGTGQPSRVVSVQLALERAGDRSNNSVLASDGFFPFTDGLETAIKGGVTAIVQPGGSIRDKEVIDMANKYNIAMTFTGVRHFRH